MMFSRVRGLARVDEPAAGWLAGHREVADSGAAGDHPTGQHRRARGVHGCVCLLAALTARAWAPIAVGVTAGGGIGW